MYAEQLEDWTIQISKEAIFTCVKKEQEAQVLKIERDLVLAEIVKEKEEIIHQIDVEGHQLKEDTHLHQIEEENIHVHLHQKERKDILLHRKEKRDILLHHHLLEKNLLKNQILNKI
jgi:hypothetical protein